MNNCVKKVIRASAGTGKTYRLSLEFIGLLLRFRHLNIHFSEILVITFTKKATAEIRERIFSHLRDITGGTEKGQDLCEKIHGILKIRITQDDIGYLQVVFQDMLINKNQVQISTIDSFIKKIFQTTIAPYLGITDFAIDNTMNPEWYAVILESIFKNARKFDPLKEFFTRTNFKNIERYTYLIKTVIENRWLFQFMDEWQDNPLKQSKSDEEIQALWDQFQKLYGEVLEKLQNHINAKNINSTASVLVKKASDLFFGIGQKPAHSQIAVSMKQKIADKNFIRDKHKEFLPIEKFWNDSTCFGKKDDKSLSQELKDESRQAYKALADYLFATALLNEEKEIILLAQFILEEYDNIKFREKVFSHSDIAFYTFKYLYDRELSLIEHNSVTNVFYEILSTYTRFILIDEFQDTSIVQFKILLPVIMEVISGSGIKDYGGAVVVGDEKQSIYGWREGERDLLLRIPDILMEAEQTALNTSFRSRPLILDFINKVFSQPRLHEALKDEDILWPYTAIAPAAYESMDQGSIQVCFRNYSDKDNDISGQSEAIREFIENNLLPALHNKQISLKDTAILTRRNEDLTTLASILGEYGIPYVLESSLSIFAHPAIKPILALYQFLVFFDPVDLLTFLRSDVVLIQPAQLKRILLAMRDRRREQHSVLAVLNELDDIPEVATLLQVLEKTSALTSSKPDLLNLTRMILEQYNISGIFHQKNDLKNVLFFLEVIADFESVRDYSKDLPGFIRYCRDFEKNKEMQQHSLTEIEAIKILSIHKAKGLEFENVFVYWNLSARGSNAKAKMNTYIDYRPDFSGISDCVLTFNYDDIIPLSHASPLARRQKVSAAIEHLNIFYVAVTRAKSNLLVFFSYNKTGGLEKYLEKDAKEKIDVDVMVASTVLQVCRDQGVVKEMDNNRTSAQLGNLLPCMEKESAAEIKDYSFIKNYLDTDRCKHLEKDQDRLSREAYLDFKTLYIRHRNTDRGNVAHYYLSFITYAEPRERLIARNRTLAFYGSLLPVAEIESLIQKLDQFIDDHAELFSRDKWTRVFTEYTLFSSHGEVRLDRLMIDEKNKQVFVVDYKTGEGYSRDQIQSYIQTMNLLPVVKKEGYKVSGEYVEVEIN